MDLAVAVLSGKKFNHYRMIPVPFSTSRFQFIFGLPLPNLDSELPPEVFLIARSFILQSDAKDSTASM